MLLLICVKFFVLCWKLQQQQKWGCPSGCSGGVLSWSSRATVEHVLLVFLPQLT